MKRERILIGTLVLGLLLALAAGVSQAQRPDTQEDLASQDAASTLLGTAFTYQGRLMDDSGNPLTGSYDFQFELYDAESGVSQVGSTVTVGDVAVSDGLFTVQLDFGSEAFTGDARWLEIGVRAGSSDGAYTALDPRQPLTPAPYALSLRPGAVISDTTTGTYVGLNQRRDSMLTVDYGVLAETWGNLDHAVFGTAHGNSSIGVGGSSDHLDGYGGLFSNSADGVAILAAGSGIIESTADSILYLSPHDMVVRGGSGVSVTPLDNGGVDIYHWSTGDKYLSIPVSTFGTLFGSPLYVKSIQVCYKTDATGYIDVTSVRKNNGSTGSTSYLTSGTNLTSSTHACYAFSIGGTRVVIDNSTWVQFNIHTSGTGHTYIYTVELTLTEQQN